MLSHRHDHALPTATVTAAFGRQNLEHRIPDQCGDRIQGGQDRRPAGHSTLVAAWASMAFEGFAPDLQQMILGLVMDGAAWPVCTEMWPGGVVNLAARGMLVMSVARRLRSEDPLPAYCAAPL